MSERALQVGDLVQVISAYEPQHQKLIGEQAMIVKICAGPGGKKYAVLNPRLVGPNRKGLYLMLLRRIPPKDEPISDFTAGEWSLCPWRPSTVKA